MREGKLGRVIIERFRKGEDVLERLNQMVRDNHVFSGSFLAIGSVEKAEIGFYVGDGQYSTTSCSGPLEVSSCIGNVSSKQGAPFVHAHISLADKEGKAYGGHLMPGCTVDATFEVVLHAYERLDLERRLDRATKLYLLDA
jgi:uncharacterized protein